MPDAWREPALRLAYLHNAKEAQIEPDYFFEWLVEFFDVCDPMDLIYQKENLREYASESNVLRDALPALESVAEVTAKLSQIFEHAFTADTVRDFDFASYATIIYKRWQQARPGLA